MAEGRLAPAPTSHQEHYVSAPNYGADFYFSKGFELEAERNIAELVLESDAAFGEGEYVSAVFDLRNEMAALLSRHRDKYDRNSAAADYAAYYRDELLDFPDEGLSYHQESALMVAQVYLSTLESLGQLGRFIEVGKWTGRKSDSFEDAKVNYLAARKKFQDDIDEYFDHFNEEPPEVLYQGLVDSINIARLTITGKRFIDAQTDDHTHVFLGSVLSERAVKTSLQEFVHPESRYGTEDEDKSPTKADVVFPIRGGDMYVQVKMRWQKPTELKVQPKKTPPHVVVPMQYIRGHLTAEEKAKVAEIISAAAERKERKLEIDEALALGGLDKYKSLFHIPIKHFSAWWKETKQIVSNEKLDNVVPLRTGVDREKLAA